MTLEWYRTRAEGRSTSPSLLPRRTKKTVTFLLGPALAATAFDRTNTTIGHLDSHQLPDPALIEFRTAGGLRMPLAGTSIPSDATDGTALKGTKFGDALMELRQRTGLTWDRLASLFGVDRRSVHFWASGRPLSSANAERVARVLSLVRSVDRGAPDATCLWLLTPDKTGLTPFELLRQRRYDEIELPPGGRHVERPTPPRLSPEAAAERAPSPPDQLVGACEDNVHVERGRLIKSVPLNTKRPT
jgi:transcriptional regulator with XRE-family HTH domain